MSALDHNNAVSAVVEICQKKYAKLHNALKKAKNANVRFILFR